MYIFQVKTFLENSELFIAYAKMWSDVYRSNTSYQGKFPFWSGKYTQHGHPEQCSSKFPDLILRETSITVFNLTSRTGVFFELSSLFFGFSSFKQAEVGETRHRVKPIFFHAPQHVRVWFDPRSGRGRLKNSRRKDLSFLYAIFENANHLYS